MKYIFRSFFLPIALASTTFAVAQKAAVATRPTVRVTAKIDRNARVILPGTHPSVVARSTMGGRLAGATQLQHMVLVLSASDDQNAALQSLMDAQQDKTSRSYHKWLTPDTFGASFGVAAPDIAQVSAWLADSGLPVESVSRSGRFITFSGTVSAVETAFSTEMHNLVYNGEAHIANTTDISVPAAIAPVVKGVARLNNFFPKSPIQNLGKVTVPKNPSNSVELSPDYNSLSTGRHYVGARDLATIYNATPLQNAGIDGTGTSISVLARSNITLADVEVYRSFFGLPKNDPNIIVVGSDPGENGDDIEAFLDAEMAGALATGATVNFIVSSPSLVGGGIDTAGLYAVDNNIGDIITLSYGGCESSDGASGTAFWNILWEEAAAQGQTAFVSSGDSGAAGCDSSSATYSTKGYGVNALGSSNYNVSVGGSMFVDFGPAQFWATGPTVIPYSTALGYVPEAALNQSRITTTLLNDPSTAYVAGSGIFAGGGGISIYTPRPSWQTGSGISPTADSTPISGTGIASATDAIAGPHRLVPDLSFISANGHDATIFCAEGVCSENSAGGVASLGLVGGTSVGTPAMASAQALINQANGGRQGNANYYYYALATQQYKASTTACQSVNGTPANSTVTLPAPTCNFQDIIAGSNAVPTAATGTAGIGFNAVNGYDSATGLGSVNIASVANNWKTVAFNSTTTTLSLTPQSTTHGSTQIGLIQVSSNSGTPTGDVSIIASSYPATGTPEVYTLTGGAVNAIVDSLPGGTYNVHAHYGGDGTYAASDSAPVSVTISQEASTFAAFQPYLLTSAGSLSAIFSANYGAGEIYVDTELSSASGNGNPSGTVTYAIQKNGVNLPGLTTNLDTYGTTYIIAGPPITAYYLTPNYPTFTPGTYSITATYSGDASLTGSSATAAFTINKATPTVSYTTGTADLTSGSPAVLNFSITTPAAAAPATGTVTFTDTTTGTVLGTASLVNGGVVFSSPAMTTSGANSIAAVYSGDTNYNPATPTALTVNVTSAAAVTGTTLTASTTTPFVGTSVTLTAAINPLPTLAATVKFYDGAVLLGSSAVSLVTGKATLAVTNLVAGTHYPTANYAGSTNQLASIGFVQVNVSRNTTTISVSGGETSTFGQQVAFNGTITRSPTSTTVPTIPLTGSVNFYEGSTAGALLGSVIPTFGPGGYGFYTATFNTSTLAAGAHSIVASYPGDANYAGSTSVAAPLVVKVNQTITFTGLPATAVYGAAGPYVLNAVSTSGLPIVYTVSGPATVSGNLLTITGLGTVIVTASQPGDTYNNPATPVSQTIVITTGSVQLSSSTTATKASGGGYLVAVTIRNVGSSAATNVQIASLTVGSTAAAPATVGTIAAGSSATTTVFFPASTGASGSVAIEKLSVTYTGGGFSGTSRLALP